jgi:hypothetical protein
MASDRLRKLNQSYKLSRHLIKSNYLNAQTLLNRVLPGKQGIDGIQDLGVEIPFAALGANFRFHIFDDVELTV